MKKVFVDTDIIIDLFAKRIPHFTYANQLFTLADLRKINIYVSSLCFSNLFYILSKNLSNDKAKEILAQLKIIVKVLKVDDKIIEQSLKSKFRDFEDAIQHFCALEAHCDLIITRNKKDYINSLLPILTAEEFIKTYK